MEQLKGQMTSLQDQFDSVSSESERRIEALRQQKQEAARGIAENKEAIEDLKAHIQKQQSAYEEKANELEKQIADQRDKHAALLSSE